MGKQSAATGRVPERAPAAKPIAPKPGADAYEGEAGTTAAAVLRRRGVGVAAVTEEPAPIRRSAPNRSPVTRPARIVQRKKTGPYPGFAAGSGSVLVRTLSAGTIFEPSGGDESARDRRVYEYVSHQYDQSHAKGLAVWTRLLGQLVAYQRSTAELVQQLRARRAEYERRWSEQYATSFSPSGQSVRAVTHGRSGVGPDAATGGKGYFNFMDTANDTIHAVANYGNDDPARLVGQGLNNSEILWQQYLAVMRAKHDVFEQPAERVTERIAELSHVVRSQLANPIVQRVVYFCYPDHQDWNTDRRWTPDHQEFYALLGTPNVGAVAYLLIDHIDELHGKTIESITTTAEQNIDIQFGAAPDIAELEWELRVLAGAPIASKVLGPTDLGTQNPLMGPAPRQAPARDAAPRPIDLGEHPLMMSPLRRRAATADVDGTVQRRFIDGTEDWVAVSSRQKRSGEDYERSAELAAIDAALRDYRDVEGAPVSLLERADRLNVLLGRITAWETAKQRFGRVRSRRTADVAELKTETVDERTRVLGLVGAAGDAAESTRGEWDSDRAKLQHWVEEGFRQDDDVRLRNSCEWLYLGRAHLFNVIPTHDSSDRARVLEPERATDHTVAWTPLPAAGWPGAVGRGAPDELYDPTDQAEPNYVFPDLEGLGTEGWNMQGVIVVTHPTIVKGREAVWQTLKHEVQHDADWHGSTESMRGVTLAQQAVAEVPEAGERTLESMAASATAKARVAAERALVRYKSEYRAYSYMGDAPEGTKFGELDHDAANPTRLDYDLRWTPRQLAIFRHIKAEYGYVADAWGPDNWTRERHLRQSTSGSLVDPDVIEEFRRRVNEYRDPDTEGANKLNSVRIDALYRALDAVGAGTTDPADAAVQSVLEAAALLDAADRRYLGDPASSPAMQVKIDHHLDGKARIEVRAAIDANGN